MKNISKILKQLGVFKVARTDEILQAPYELANVLSEPFTITFKSHEGPRGL